MLDWSRPRLAQESGLSLRALVKLEAGQIERPRPDTLAAIENAFRMAGVEFIDQGAAGPGVRFSEPKPWPTWRRQDESDA